MLGFSALYQNPPPFPTEEQRLTCYAQILNISGCSEREYTLDEHLTWCYLQVKRACPLSNPAGDMYMYSPV